MDAGGTCSAARYRQMLNWSAAEDYVESRPALFFGTATLQCNWTPLRRERLTYRPGGLQHCRPAFTLLPYVAVYCLSLLVVHCDIIKHSYFCREKDVGPFGIVT